MTMTQAEFQAIVQEGLPETLPPAVERNPEWSHAPVRKDILTAKEKELALRNALRISRRTSMRNSPLNLPKSSRITDAFTCTACARRTT